MKKHIPIYLAARGLVPTHGKKFAAGLPFEQDVPIELALRFLMLPLKELSCQCFPITRLKQNDERLTGNPDSLAVSTRCGLCKDVDGASNLLYGEPDATHPGICNGAADNDRGDL